MEPRVPIQVVGPFLLAMMVPAVAVAQRFATASATGVLVLRVPSRGSLVAPKQLSRAPLAERSRLDVVEQVGLFQVGARTTRGTGNSVLLAEWTSSEQSAASRCSLDPVEAGIAPRPPSRLAELAEWTGRRTPRGMRVRLRWDPDLPYRNQWASVSPPRLPAAGEATAGGHFPALRGRPGAGELRAEVSMTRGIATPLLAVGPGQVLTEGRFYASIGLPDDGASSLTFRSTVLTLTLTEY
jgi:hypothetical protein